MLPSYEKPQIQGFKIKESPSKTYLIDHEKGRIAGMADGLLATQQTIYHILSVERYDYLIYSWNYGTELHSLYGKPTPYVKSELKRRITEALMQDDRIKNVDSFTFEEEGSRLFVTFVVHTTQGNIPAQKEVALNV